MSLIDPVIDDPKVNKDASIQEAPVEEKPEKSELQVWAESKGFDPNLDPKFLESYRNLEQDRGRLANEVGESRALMDRVIKLEEDRHATAQPQEEEFSLDPTDLLSDPVAALDTYFSKREQKLRNEYDSRIQQLEGSLSHQSLSQKHQDADQLVNDPQFLAFVQESPTRTLVAQAAVQNGDVNALDALLTEYKSGNRQPAQEATDPGATGREAARAASLESSATSGGTSDGKIYSRAALIRMKIEDPEAYSDPAFQDAIKQAYIEKRVR